jgi:hypothetical protein
VSGIGGWSVRPLLGRVQRLSGENGARQCFYGAPEGWAGVSSRRQQCAVQACVKSRARRDVCVQERGARSGRAGRPDGVALAWIGGGAWSRSSGTGSGNWSVGLRRCWWRGDGSGGGRWCSAPVGRPQRPWQSLGGRGVILQRLCDVG